MLRKIISGGQTGADQAALDVAIKMDIPHGGWIPRGRRTEQGPLSPNYLLQEMETTSYSARTEKNVVDSDGTVIFSHGDLTGGSELTRQLARKHHRPCLHLDLNRVIAFKAAQQLNTWLQQNNIEVLNVAGTRGSHDPRIYQATMDVLQTTLYMEIIDGIPSDGIIPANLFDSQEGKHLLPPSIDQAVSLMLGEFTFKDKSKIANVAREDLSKLINRYGPKIQHTLGLSGENHQLLQACASLVGKDALAADDAVELIIRLIWEKLRVKKNVLRIIK